MSKKSERILAGLREAIEYARTGEGDVKITVIRNLRGIPGTLRSVRVIDGGLSDKVS